MDDLIETARTDSSNWIQVYHRFPVRQLRSRKNFHKCFNHYFPHIPIWGDDVARRAVADRSNSRP